MSEHILIALAAVIVLGIGAQWIAWRTRLPSILLLLPAGLLAGPGFGLLDPDALFGELLLPMVSLSVAVILFEGGLTLRLAELPKVGRTVLNLISVGALSTWLIASVAAYLLLELNIEAAALLGAIVIVTGPTVTGPLLRHVRPTAKLNSILKWEGIAIDPLGVMFAVLVFEVLLAGGEFPGVPTLAAVFLLKTLIIGGAIGGGVAALLLFLLRRYLIPDFLQNPVALMAVVSAFAVSDILQPESGLLTVTVMGVVLANQKSVPVKHIVEFKENLRVLLISSLFILLAARLQVHDLTALGLGAFAFLAVLILIARPAAVFLSTIRQGLSLNEKLFLSWMAPRGIVAASMSSVFALSLTEAGNDQAAKLVPLTFFVIIGTVLVYGFSASAAARRLKVAQPDPQGALILGAHPWARAIGEALHTAGFRVLMVDINRDNINAARMAGLDTYYGNILSDKAMRSVDLNGIGRFLALTANDEINSLAVLQFAHVFGRSEVYQLNTESGGGVKEAASARDLLGRLLFEEGATFSALSEKFAAGATIKRTPLTPEFDYRAFLDEHGAASMPLFIINPSHEVAVFTGDSNLSPEPDQTIISLVDPPSRQAAEPSEAGRVKA